MQMNVLGALVCFSTGGASGSRAVGCRLVEISELASPALNCQLSSFLISFLAARWEAFMPQLEKAV
ncbi:hypothetical protein C2S52_018869 [Perilla frutescens var. hirtella]|uniref:Uncharacterized protein n=1 Tax=Perilla frutescens var. hirtella TaxID=608512 RepID=A0AAD4P5X9_PERFH|nr:hypothetical protein C2S52_018869 [Perilla frutescens var. hirtella]KAH6812544.1 hypothetical protein C2S51_026306 [Perilla frutescens var. frutescens]KAH6827456.1 hypothetical protein C2S53_002493 [Perilla frutescens var. hirtella]